MYKVFIRSAFIVVISVSLLLSACQHKQTEEEGFRQMCAQYAKGKEKSREHFLKSPKDQKVLKFEYLLGSHNIPQPWGAEEWGGDITIDSLFLFAKENKQELANFISDWHYEIPDYEADDYRRDRLAAQARERKAKDRDKIKVKFDRLMSPYSFNDGNIVIDRNKLPNLLQFTESELEAMATNELPEYNISEIYLRWGDKSLEVVSFLKEITEGEQNADHQNLVPATKSN